MRAANIIYGIEDNPKRRELIEAVFKDRYGQDQINRLIGLYDLFDRFERRIRKERDQGKAERKVLV